MKEDQGSSSWISTRIRLLRKEKNLSQLQVAEKIGVDVATYGAWEREQFDIKVKYLEKLAELYKVPVTYFHDESKWISKPTRMNHDLLEATMYKSDQVRISSVKEDSSSLYKVNNDALEKEVAQLKEQNLALSRAYNELYEKNINQSKKRVYHE